MACCNRSVPTFNALSIAVTDTAATITIDGTLPVSGRFNVRVCGNCLNVCSATPIAITDAAGTSITNIIGRCCGNRVLLGKVAVQARRHKLLHFCRSTDTNTLVLLLDKICAPTPIVDTTTTPTSAANAVATKTKA